MTLLISYHTHRRRVALSFYHTSSSLQIQTKWLQHSPVQEEKKGNDTERQQTTLIVQQRALVGNYITLSRISTPSVKVKVMSSPLYRTLPTQLHLRTTSSATIRGRQWLELGWRKFSGEIFRWLHKSGVKGKWHQNPNNFGSSNTPIFLPTSDHFTQVNLIWWQKPSTEQKITTK